VLKSTRHDIRGLINADEVGCAFRGRNVGRWGDRTRSKDIAGAISLSAWNS